MSWKSNMKSNSIEQHVVKLICGDETGNAVIVDNFHAITVKHCIRNYIENGESIKLICQQDGEKVLSASLEDCERLKDEQIVVLSISPQTEMTTLTLLSYKPLIFEKAATVGFDKNYFERAIWQELKCVGNNNGGQSDLIHDLVFKGESKERSVKGLSGSPIVKFDNRENVYGLVSMERCESGSQIDIEGISIASHMDYLKRKSITIHTSRDNDDEHRMELDSDNKWDLYLKEDNHLKPYMFNAKVIEFCGRHNELNELMKFVDDSQKFSWWVLTGASGSGKSRIAYELSNKLSETGWVVSYLYNGDISKLDVARESAKEHKNCLIIADNAGAYSSVLGKWMLEILDNLNSKVRVLIIDRNTSLNSNDMLFRGLFEYDLNGQLLAYLWNKEFLKLSKLDDEEIKKIIHLYADYKNLIIDEDTMENLLNILNAIDRSLMRPLYAMFIVDAWSEGFKLNNCKLDSILEWIIQKEYSYRSNIIRECVGDVRVNLRRIRSVDTLLFIATINGGIDLQSIKDRYNTYWNEAKRTIEESATCAELEEVLTSIGLLVNDRIMVPIKPDILGEYYVISNFNKMKEAMFIDNWADNERLQEFVFRMLFEYTDKTINNKAFRSLFFHSFLQGKPQTQNAIDIYSQTLNELIYYDELDNILVYIEKLAEILDYNGGLHCAKNYAFGLVNLSAKQTDIRLITDTIDKLKNLEEKFNNSDIRFSYAQGLFNLANNQELLHKYKTIKKIKQLLDKDNSNQGVALEYAKSLYNLYGYQPTEAEMKTAEELKCLSEAYPKNEDIAKEYAMFLYNIQDEGFNKEQISSIIAQLFELSLRFTSNVDIQFYIIWALKFIANNQNDTDAVHTKSVIGRIKQNLDKEDIEKIEVEGAMKFYKDENGEPLFKVINIGGRIYLNDGDVL